MKAFPSAEPIYSKDIVGIKESAGMDLRDYFAAKAMQGVVAGDLKPSVKNVDIAKFAYAMADAMMEARKEKK